MAVAIELLPPPRVVRTRPDCGRGVCNYELPPRRIGLLRDPHERSPLVEALAGHVISSLDNLSHSHSAAAE